MSDGNLHRFFIEGLSQTDYLNIAYLQGAHLSQASRRFIELAREILPKTLLE